jgi:hypothetical protein
VPFFTSRIRPNLHSVWCMVRVCSVWCLSLSAGMRGHVRTNIGFGIKSKTPFVTARFRLNLHWMRSMGKECHIWCLSHPAAIRGYIRKKNYLGLWSKVPFVTIRFRLNWHRISGTRDVWVSPLQCEARYGRKSVSFSRAKCPSLLPDFNQTRTRRGSFWGIARCDVRMSRIECEAR